MFNRTHENKRTLFYNLFAFRFCQFESSQLDFKHIPLSENYGPFTSRRMFQRKLKKSSEENRSCAFYSYGCECFVETSERPIILHHYIPIFRTVQTNNHSSFEKLKSLGTTTDCANHPLSLPLPSLSLPPLSLCQFRHPSLFCFLLSLNQYSPIFN